MNFKSTLYLAFALALLAAGYLWLRSETGPANEATAGPKQTFGRSLNERDLIETEEQPRDLVKITARRKDGEEWVFEKREVDAEEADAVAEDEKRWYMTAPIEMMVTSYDVDRIGREIRNLRYEVSYGISEPGAPTLAEVGLDPPDTVVTMSDADGKSVSLEIGRAASERDRYVRLAGRDEYCVAVGALDNLLKETALEYREKQLWKFAPDDVTHINIVDRSNPPEELHYAFAKNDGRWMIESPITARATAKLDEVIRSLSNLRAVGWHDSRPERLASYGLDPATWTIQCTAEETIESESDESPVSEQEETEQEEPRPPQVRVREFTLHLSDRTPIGEDTKVYMRVDDESVVGSIMKYAADKFKPDLSQWRDMSMTTANVTSATQVELSTSNDHVTLVKKDGAWSFDPDGTKAEDAAVRALLQTIQSLKAVAFTDGEPGDLAQYGLDAPRAQIRLTIPGIEEAERLSVGGFSDPDTQRLVYARRNEVASIAKVRASDAAELTQDFQAYQDRTILNIPTSQVDRIAVTRDDHCTGIPVTLTFERGEDGWHMTAPIAASVRDKEFRGLVDAIGGLRAESIVSHSDQSVLGCLETPVARITIEHRTPAEGDADLEESEEGPPPPPKTDDRRETVVLRVAEHGGRYYAGLADRSTAYEVSKEFFDRLFAEYRSDEVLAFDESEVEEFTVRNQDQVHSFKRKGTEWSYQPEPDLPLDAKKVDNLLLQFKDLDTQRFVGYGETDPERFGLASPTHEITLKLKDDKSVTLRVSGKACTRYPQDGLYSSVSGRDGILLLKADSVNRLTVSLDDLERKP